MPYALVGEAGSDLAAELLWHQTDAPGLPREAAQADAAGARGHHDGSVVQLDFESA
jgi:hypothetical protein